MSTSTASPSQVPAAQSAPAVAQTSGEGGSLPDAGDQAGGAADNQDTQVSQEPQAPSGQSSQASRTSSSARAVDEETLFQMQQELEQYKAIVMEVGAKMDRDPELRQKLEGASRPASVRESLGQKLRSVLKPEAAEALEAALGDDLDALDRRLAALERDRPRIDGAVRAMGSYEYQQALEENGISGDVQRRPEFQKFAQKHSAGPYKNLPVTVRAELIAAKWANSTRSAALNRNTNAVVSTARSAANGATTARNTAGAAKVVQILRDGNQVQKAYEIRAEAQNAGRPLPKIEFVDKLG